MKEEQKFIISQHVDEDTEHVFSEHGASYDSSEEPYLSNNKTNSSSDDTVAEYEKLKKYDLNKYRIGEVIETPDLTTSQFELAPGYYSIEWCHNTAGVSAFPTNHFLRNTFTNDTTGTLTFDISNGTWKIVDLTSTELYSGTFEFNHNAVIFHTSDTNCWDFANIFIEEGQRSLPNFGKIYLAKHKITFSPVLTTSSGNTIEPETKLVIRDSLHDSNGTDQYYFGEDITENIYCVVTVPEKDNFISSVIDQTMDISVSEGWDPIIYASFLNDGTNKIYCDSTGKLICGSFKASATITTKTDKLSWNNRNVITISNSSKTITGAKYSSVGCGKHQYGWQVNRCGNWEFVAQNNISTLTYLGPKSFSSLEHTVSVSCLNGSYSGTVVPYQNIKFYTNDLTLTHSLASITKDSEDDVTFDNYKYLTDFTYESTWEAMSSDISVSFTHTDKYLIAFFIGGDEKYSYKDDVIATNIGVIANNVSNGQIDILSNTVLYTFGKTKTHALNNDNTISIGHDSTTGHTYISCNCSHDLALSVNMDTEYTLTINTNDVSKIKAGTDTPNNPPSNTNLDEIEKIILIDSTTLYTEEIEYNSLTTYSYSDSDTIFIFVKNSCYYTKIDDSSTQLPPGSSVMDIGYCAPLSPAFDWTIHGLKFAMPSSNYDLLIVITDRYFSINMHNDPHEQSDLIYSKTKGYYKDNFYFYITLENATYIDPKSRLIIDATGDTTYIKVGEVDSTITENEKSALRASLKKKYNIVVETLVTSDGELFNDTNAEKVYPPSSFSSKVGARTVNVETIIFGSDQSFYYRTFKYTNTTVYDSAIDSECKLKSPGYYRIISTGGNSGDGGNGGRGGSGILNVFNLQFFNWTWWDTYCINFGFSTNGDLDSYIASKVADTNPTYSRTQGLQQLLGRIDKSSVAFCAFEGVGGYGGQGGYGFIGGDGGNGGDGCPVSYNLVYTEYENLCLLRLGFGFHLVISIPLPQSTKHTQHIGFELFGNPIGWDITYYTIDWVDKEIVNTGSASVNDLRETLPLIGMFMSGGISGQGGNGGVGYLTRGRGGVGGAVDGSIPQGYQGKLGWDFENDISIQAESSGVVQDDSTEKYSISISQSNKTIFNYCRYFLPYKLKGVLSDIVIRKHYASYDVNNVTKKVMTYTSFANSETGNYDTVSENIYEFDDTWETDPDDYDASIITGTVSIGQKGDNGTNSPDSVNGKDGLCGGSGCGGNPTYVSLTASNTVIQPVSGSLMSSVSTKSVYRTRKFLVVAQGGEAGPITFTDYDSRDWPGYSESSDSAKYINAITTSWWAKSGLSNKWIGPDVYCSGSHIPAFWSATGVGLYYQSGNAYMWAAEDDNHTGYRASYSSDRGITTTTQKYTSEDAFVNQHYLIGMNAIQLCGSYGTNNLYSKIDALYAAVYEATKRYTNAGKISRWNNQAPSAKNKFCIRQSSQEISGGSGLPTLGSGGTVYLRYGWNRYRLPGTKYLYILENPIGYHVNTVYSDSSICSGVSFAEYLQKSALKALDASNDDGLKYGQLINYSLGTSSVEDVYNGLLSDTNTERSTTVSKLGSTNPHVNEFLPTGKPAYYGVSGLASVYSGYACYDLFSNGNLSSVSSHDILYESLKNSLASKIPKAKVVPALTYGSSSWPWVGGGIKIIYLGRDTGDKSDPRPTTVKLLGDKWDYSNKEYSFISNLI